MDKILVYDADPRFREVVKAALASIGYEGVLAADGYTVLPLAQQQRPRLAVLEYKLPESDGVEMLKRLRGVPEFALTPVIFASTTPKFEIEMAILDAPAVGYIDKPLDANQLKLAIEALIGPVKVAAPAAPPPSAYIPPPGAPLEPPVFNGEPDLDGTREDVIDLD